MKSIIVFDFDGTLADSFDLILNVVSSEVRGEGQRWSRQGLRGLGTRQALSKLKLSPLESTRLLMKVRSKMRSEISQVALFPNLATTLKTLADLDQEMAIISSNSCENIKLFLHNHDLEDVFFTIVEVNSLFGKHHELKKLVKRYPNRSLIYVGDETRDIEAARKAKVLSAAVGWGYTNEDTLKEWSPDIFFRNPMQLIALAQPEVQSPDNRFPKLLR